MKNIINKLFRVPSADELRVKELADAERDLLTFEAAVEYDIAMRDMLMKRVARLKSEKKE